MTTAIDKGTGYGLPAGTYERDLVEVGPGTPMGELLRRYWHPIGLIGDATAVPRKVRALGEDLVLFRDGDGRAGLLRARCCHRGTTLYYGKVEPDGLRCCYHGWKFDYQGMCLDQPIEPGGGVAKSRYRQPWYPLQERYGLIFAYMGPPDKKPALPRYAALENMRDGEWVEADDSSIGTGGPVIAPWNWLQNVENIVDQAHVPVLHVSHSGNQFNDIPIMIPDKLNFAETESGVTCETINGLANGDDYVSQSAIFFPLQRIVPNPLFVPHDDDPTQRIDDIGWILPIDDHSFRIYVAGVVRKAGALSMMTAQVGTKPRTAATEADMRQYPGDAEAQGGQGVITFHNEEHLTSTDRGVGLYRRLLRRQMDVVASGADPMNVSFDEQAKPIAFSTFRGVRRSDGSIGSTVAEIPHSSEPVDPSGRWDATTRTPLGEQSSVIHFCSEDGSLTGVGVNQFGETRLEDLAMDGNQLTWVQNMTKPFPMRLEFEVRFDGESFAGDVRAGNFGRSPIMGRRQKAEVTS